MTQEGDLRSDGDQELLESVRETARRCEAAMGELIVTLHKLISCEDDRPPSLKDVINEVWAERISHEHGRGFDADHDDLHEHGELAIAAACYAVEHTDARVNNTASPGNVQDEFHGWPWDLGSDKRKDHAVRKRLIIAASLLVAEVQRINRRKADERE